MAVEDNLYSFIRVYKTTYQGYEGLSDMEAKKALSGNAYKRFFVKALESSARLQHRVLESGDAVVWRASEPWQVTDEIPPDDAVIISSGMRCSCHTRIAHNIQCAHEFCVAKKFELSKYHSRWYNKRTYAVHNPRSNHSVNHGQDILTQLEDDEDPNREEDLDDDDNDDNNPFDGVSSSMVVDEDNEEPLEVSYPELLNLCEILVRTVANDKKEKRKVHSIVQGMITRYRKGSAFVVHFDDHLPVSSQVVQENNTNVCQPVRAITQSVANSSKVGRKMSAREHIVRKKAKRGMNGTQLSQCSQADDDDHLGPPKSLSRNCRLCRLGGHGQFQCPSLLQYGSPLEKNNGILRAEVATELMKSTSYVNTNLASSDERIIHATLPTATKAVILHARYIKDEGQTFLLEATLLQVGGLPHGDYSKVIFDISAITKFLVRGKNCLFVSQLKRST
jgi:hypothetical protein